MGLSVGQAILEKCKKVNLIKFNKIHAFSQLLASAYGLVIYSIVSILLQIYPTSHLLVGRGADKHVRSNKDASRGRDKDLFKYFFEIFFSILFSAVS